MKVKYSITDECGKTTEIVKEEVKEDEGVEEEVEEKAKDSELTVDEITALKKLASIADKLVELLKTEKDEHAAVQKEEQDVEDKKADKEEKVIETRDSFGSCEKKEKRIDDSLTDTQADIWAKRYSHFGG